MLEDDELKESEGELEEPLPEEEEGGDILDGEHESLEDMALKEEEDEDEEEDDEYPDYENEDEV